MNSTQLIEFYKVRKEALGEKATDWNMFLEGYGAGISDVDIRNAIVKETTEKACEWLDDVLYSEHINSGMDKNRLLDAFRKAMEE